MAAHLIQLEMFNHFPEHFNSSFPKFQQIFQSLCCVASSSPHCGALSHNGLFTAPWGWKTGAWRLVKTIVNGCPFQQPQGATIFPIHAWKQSLTSNAKARFILSNIFFSFTRQNRTMELLIGNTDKANAQRNMMEDISQNCQRKWYRLRLRCSRNHTSNSWVKGESQLVAPEDRGPSRWLS